MDIINKYNNILSDLNNLNLNNIFFDLINENNELKVINEKLTHENNNLKNINENITNENIKLNDEISNFNKVSVLQSINKQLNDKMSYITILEKQLANYKSKVSNNIKPNINNIVLEPDSVNINNIILEEIEENYELIKYKNNNYYKELKTNLIYDIKNDKPNKIVGKMRTSGKIKLN